MVYPSPFLKKVLARACGSGRAILFLVYQEVSSVQK